jgi:hypothetical protein
MSLEARSPVAFTRERYRFFFGIAECRKSKALKSIHFAIEIDRAGMVNYRQRQSNGMPFGRFIKPVNKDWPKSNFDWPIKMGRRWSCQPDESIRLEAMSRQDGCGVVGIVFVSIKKLGGLVERQPKMHCQL